MKRVIIVGANGFIGSSVVNRMVSESVEVIAIDICHDNPKYKKSDLITTIACGLADEEKLLSMIPQNEYDAIYNFAWRGVNGQEKANPHIQLANIDYAIVCASIAKKLGCKKYLCAGSVAERAVESLNNIATVPGGMLYGASKYCAHVFLETYCKNIGLDFIWMQFSNIYGPTNKTGNLVSYTLSQLFENNEATFGPAAQPYDFIYVDDLIEAVYRLGEAKTKNNFYFIGSGKPRILKEYLFKIGELCNKADLIKVGERNDDGITYTMDMFDTKDLVQEIGNYASHSFEEGIKITIDNY